MNTRTILGDFGPYEIIVNEYIPRRRHPSGDRHEPVVLGDGVSKDPGCTPTMLAAGIGIVPQRQHLLNDKERP